MNRAQHLRSRLHGWELHRDLLSAVLGTANEPYEFEEHTLEATHHSLPPAKIGTNGLFRLQERAFRIAV